VRLQCAYLLERLLTSIAFVRSFARVRTVVRGEIRLCRERSVAQIARVRLRVLATVTDELVRTRAPFAAYVALVFVGVGVFAIRMRVHSGSCFESLIAFIAVHCAVQK
jgi:hypothetical protein